MDNFNKCELCEETSVIPHHCKSYLQWEETTITIKACNSGAGIVTQDLFTVELQGAAESITWNNNNQGDPPLPTIIP